MISCDPNALAQAAKCLACLQPEVLRWVRTYLLCQIAAVSNTNLVPPGSQYDDNGFFDVTPLVIRGATYRFTAGATEIANLNQIQNGNCPPAIPLDGGSPVDVVVICATGLVRVSCADFSTHPVTFTLVRLP